MSNENKRPRTNKRYIFEAREDKELSNKEEEFYAKAYKIDFLGTHIDDKSLREIEVLTNVLMALKDGLPRPYDPIKTIEKIERSETRTRDYSALKDCCPPCGEIHEAKEVKPAFLGILDRIIELGGLSKYVDNREFDYK